MYVHRRVGSDGATPSPGRRDQSSKSVQSAAHNLKKQAARRQAVMKSDASARSAVVAVGDIGGTNSRLGLWATDPVTGQCEEIFSKIYPVAAFPSFELAMLEFVNEMPVRNYKVQAAALAVAGAVVNNRCAMTNTSWVVDGYDLERHFGFKVKVLNDFEAVGYGIPALGAKDIVAINDAAVTPMAPKVVMGPGTGLGAAQLFYDSGLQAYTVIPGEGAHATFAPRGWRQNALAAWVLARMGHCEIEEVACGHGIELIYEFLLSDTASGPRHDMPQAKRTAPEISSLAREGQDPIATEAIDMFLCIVGAEAGAMALRCLAKGGVYIAGGIVPKLMNRVARGGFFNAFTNPAARDKFHAILKEIPLFVVTNERVGMIGSREVALGLLKQQQEMDA